ncbi:MAG TPA: hypothetical protein VF158_00895 [Longimicrobiales bacterium]
MKPYEENGRTYEPARWVRLPRKVWTTDERGRKRKATEWRVVSRCGRVLPRRCGVRYEFTRNRKRAA